MKASVKNQRISAPMRQVSLQIRDSLVTMKVKVPLSLTRPPIGSSVSERRR